MPLNIFEPRYLNMIDDALKSDRLIGMVQPKSQTHQPTTAQDLHTVGGLGRITQFAERPDGQYTVVLSGLKRFQIEELVPSEGPYLKAKINFEAFVGDADIHAQPNTPKALSGEAGQRSALTMAMKVFAKTLGVKVDWDELNKIALPQLVDQTAMISPFPAEDKQSLLKAADHEERRRLLIGLMHLYSDSSAGASRPNMN